MNNWVKIAIAAVALVALIAGSVVLYDKLKDEYKPNVNHKHMGNAGFDIVKPEQDAPTEQPEVQDENIIPAPDFIVYDIEGNPVKLSDFKGKPVVLNFWATWCYYCKEEMPGFEAMHKKYPDVQFLMVNATDGYRETVESAQDYIEENGYTFDVFFDIDSDAVMTYGVNAFPSTAFIDKNGRFVNGVSGMIDEETLEECIAEIAE